MINLEDSAAAIADQLGLDLPYLQPSGEVRFDPATLAVIVGLWILRNIAEGIADGLKEESHTATQALLARISASVGRRVRKDLPTAMRSRSDEPDIDAAKAAAETAWNDTRSLLAAATFHAHSEVAEIAAQAAGDALESAGLPRASSLRVHTVLTVEIKRLVEDRG